ncbi:MAG: outer membrane beta-barrel protein [Gammaproteobacteria bacterium]|jgi:OOP family OmpA-OmpF porin|nr:hypothetical protein [Chromatiales bacterium]MCP4926032.1 outer membrane beta-barrel protein [Gammaproteobacteria bacterium]MDP7418443.1 outer membrane beta-barrel protein [Gammaproteobacteria bacterium]MDP7660606.1 outer membrane beta-barrel protein [Gammaproteobacteria bacterium]HJP39321.1 outer membrane beta-barrel protein [Gammaproteobacteria bacterium]
MKHILFILPICLFAVSGNPVIAADFSNGFYYGGSGGLTDNKNVCEDIGDPISPRNCEDQDFGWQLFVGWQFMKWIGIEGGWTNLGQSSFMQVNGTIIQSETEGLQGNVVVTVPWLEKAGLYFKAGAFLWDIEVSQADNLGNSQEISDKDIDYVLGAGLRYPLTDSLGIGLEFQQFRDIGNRKTGSFDANLVTAGLLFSF